MIKQGEQISIIGRTDGQGRFQRYNRPVFETVTQVYSDGSVQIASGDVYTVWKHKGRWLAK